MIAYVTLGSNDIERANAFYDALLASVGIKKLTDSKRGRIYGELGKPFLLILTPYDGQVATNGNGTMVALGFNDRAMVDTFHARALELGAQDEGAPGERTPGGPYLSYIRDLDGNKLAAVCLDDWRPD